MKRLLLSTTLGVLASFGVNVFSMNKEEADRVYADKKARERAQEIASRTVAPHEFENGFALELPDGPQSPPEESPQEIKATADGQQAAPKVSAAGAAGAGAAATQAKKELRKESPYTEALYEAALNDCPKQILEIIELRKCNRHHSSRNNILLIGPSGTGKTTLAQAIAYKCGLNCMFISAPFLSSKYKNGGEDNLKKIFEEAKLNQPCALVFDELEAILNKHDQNNSGDQNLLRACWTIIDECNKLGILVIATSNYIKELPDPVITRFPAIYRIDMPNDSQRKHILKFHMAQAEECLKDEFDSVLKDQLSDTPSLGARLKAKLFSTIIDATKDLSHRQLGHLISEASIAAFFRDRKKTVVALKDCFDAIPAVQKSHEVVKDPKAENAWVKVCKEDPKFVINTALATLLGLASIYLVNKGLNLQIVAAAGQEKMNLFNRIMALVNFSISRSGLKDGTTVISASSLMEVLKKSGFSPEELGGLVAIPLKK